MSSPHFKHLNPGQEKAVLKTEGPVLVIAGAGAGKTKTIAERIGHLVTKGVRPNSILAITFTNKAAKEMKDRVETVLKETEAINLPISELERPFIGTFHSLGVYILREHAEKVGRKKYFSIFDRDDSRRSIKEALLSFGLDPKTHDPGRILGIISKEKGQGKNHGDYDHSAQRGYLANVIRQVWPEYEKILARENALDFDDLLLKTLDLLAKYPEVRSHYNNVWKYIHIDEYQDTNKVQYQISKLLTGKDKNIFAVGDVDQNIYSWRGAEIKNIMAFEEDYPDAEIILLEENYRSTEKILEAANAVIVKNKIRREKNLFTAQTGGDKIVFFRGFDETNEADFIAHKAEEIVKKGVSPEEIAVLYRANFQSRALEEAFMKKSLPYQMIGTRFFERKEVKDILSYLRAALNPDSTSDLKRIINVPARGIGKVTVLKIFSGQESELTGGVAKKITQFRKILKEIEVVSTEKKVSETISFIIKSSGLEDVWKGVGDEGVVRLENAFELVNFASRYDELPPEEGITSLLADAALQSDQDEIDDKKRAIRLMTIHASKGLEFDTVFITGLEEGLFPHERMDRDKLTPEESEEERRLFYVALTRARKKVFISYAEVRNLFGRRQVNVPSRFIFDIPEYLVEDEAWSGYGPSRKPLLDIEF